MFVSDRVLAPLKRTPCRGLSSLIFHQPLPPTKRSPFANQIVLVVDRIPDLLYSDASFPPNTRCILHCILIVLILPSDRPPPAAAHAPPTVTAPQSAIDNRILHTRPSANVGVGLCTAWLLVHPCVCTHIRTHAHTHTHTHTPHSDAEWNVDTWKYKGHPHTLVVNQVDVAVPHATNYRGLGTCIHSFTHICVYSSIQFTVHRLHR